MKCVFRQKKIWRAEILYVFTSIEKYWQFFQQNHRFSQ